MSSGVVDGSDKRIVPITIDEEGIILRLRAISAKHHSAKLSFDDGHLDLVGQIAKVRGLSKAQHIHILRLFAGMIGSPGEPTAKLSIRRGTFCPIVRIICT